MFQPPEFRMSNVDCHMSNADASIDIRQSTIDISEEAVDPDRWLVVEKTRDGAPGGWATGSFDPKRNKLTIRQRDVQRFAIDVSRIPINWARLVVIGINGRNSELRKRDYSILHFARDQHGQWVVVEP